MIVDGYFRAKSGCEISLTPFLKNLISNFYLNLRWGASIGHSWRVSFLLLFSMEIRCHKAFNQTTGDIAPKWDSLASIINLYASFCFRR